MKAAADVGENLTGGGCWVQSVLSAGVVPGRLCAVGAGGRYGSLLQSMCSQSRRTAAAAAAPAAAELPIGRWLPHLPQQAEPDAAAWETPLQAAAVLLM